MNKERKKMIFGLDIGTRTVIGVIGYYEDNQFTITHHTCIEHEERAMLDGQIHDIHKVSKAVERVKKELENQSHCILTDVAIAAAGRILNTQIVLVMKKFDETKEILAKDIEELEVQGIDEAKEKLEIEKKVVAKDYFCVGHTVIQYFLDEYEISNLEGHRGYSIGAKVLCTFLPKSVIDSLYTVTDRVGLEVSHLTLEPIAAINAVIPDNLRRLNLALVDIGAGTSDIAITKEGSVIAYGMIPFAGDEITEAIMNQYLVDFTTAEYIKQQIGQEEVIKFEDIIGLSHEIPSKEVNKHITPIVKHITQTIAHKILELNGGKATNAVFCVGGGSQMNGLTQYLAKYLELPHTRVAVRMGDQVADMKYECEMRQGPEMITPLGICLTALRNESQKFIKININDKQIQILNSKKLTVLDALIQDGIDHNQLFSIHGKTLMFKLDQKRIRIKGKAGVAASIWLNDRETAIHSPIHNQDSIKIKVAIRGEDAVATIKDYITDEKVVYFNNKALVLPIALVNGVIVDTTYQIQENDQVELVEIATPRAFREFFKIKEDKAIVINGKELGDTYLFRKNDSILIENKKIENRLLESENDVIFFEKEYISESIKSEKQDEVLDRLPSSKEKTALTPSITLYVNDKNISLPIKESPYIFVNIFDYIDFDLSRPQGSIILKLNNDRAAFTDELKNEDKLEIYWEK